MPALPGNNDVNSRVLMAVNSIRDFFGPTANTEAPVV